eukprot:14279912-Ditylum_brightwellii.AAC.1
MKSPKILPLQACTDNTCQRTEALCLLSLKSLGKSTAVLSQDLPILFSVFPIPESLKEVVEQYCIRITSVKPIVLHKLNS